MATTRSLKVVYAVLGALEREIGDKLVALYTFGGISSCTYCTAGRGVNLFIVVTDDTRMLDVREALHRVWLLHRTELGQVPLVAKRAGFLRHLTLDPILAYDLATGENHAGEALVARGSVPEHIQLVARIAREAMRASAVLAPTMITKYDADRAINGLRCLAKQYVADEFSNDDPPAKLYAGVQKYIAIQMSRYNHLAVDPSAKEGGAPVLEALLAVYSMDNRLVLVLPDIPHHEIMDRITAIDWASVASRIAGEYRGLQLTTPSQLRLVMAYEGSADLSLGIIEHLWGKDLLREMDTDRRMVHRDLAKFPSELMIDKLPRSLIVSEDNDLPVLVHDLQNRLLNIQLRNELFSRLEYSVPKMPPKPLPDRSAASELRIEAIADQLEWWADYYFQQMDAV